MRWKQIPGNDEAPFLIRNFMNAQAVMTLQFTDCGLNGGKDIGIAFFLAVGDPGIQVHGVVWIDTYSHDTPTAQVSTDVGIRLDEKIKTEIQNQALAIQPRLIL